jgi:release factor glutamine methyltransferase
VEQRVSGRPLWYCIGDTDFYGYKIKVNENVLIPRPETEILVEKALKFIDSDKTVLDLCTGSGAIAITVNKKSGAKVTAVDVSEGALDVAKNNAKEVGAEVEFILSDMFNALDGRKFDVIISNPPYIKSEDIKSLQKEVRDFEPVLALDGGEDGYDFYRIILNHAKNYLVDNGVLFMECGIDQAQNIAEMFSSIGSVEIIKDYENIERIVKVVF